MMNHITQFVAECAVCQKSKYETKSLAGLLSPFSVPSKMWDGISLDFVSGLSRSFGVDCVLVVVDRLSKYTHFLALLYSMPSRLSKWLRFLHGKSCVGMVSQVQLCRIVALFFLVCFGRNYFE